MARITDRATIIAQANSADGHCIVTVWYDGIYGARSRTDQPKWWISSMDRATGKLRSWSTQSRAKGEGWQRAVLAQARKQVA